MIPKHQITILLISLTRIFLPKLFLLFPVLVFGFSFLIIIFMGIAHFASYEVKEFLVSLFPERSLDEQDLFQIIMAGVFVLGVFIAGFEKLFHKEVSLPVWRGSLVLTVVSFTIYTGVIYVFTSTEGVEFTVFIMLVLLHVFALVQLWIYLVIDKILLKLISAIRNGEVSRER